MFIFLGICSLFIFSSIITEAQCIKKAWREDTTVMVNRHNDYDFINYCFPDEWDIFYDSLMTQVYFTIRVDKQDSVQYYKSFYLSGKEKCFETGKNGGLLTAIQWCENGQVITSVKYKYTNDYVRDNNRIYKHVVYYCNGKKYRQFYMNVGNAQRTWREWYETGILKEKGYYIDNQKHKTWKYYDTEGKLIKIEKYDKGKLLEEKHTN